MRRLVLWILLLVMFVGVSGWSASAQADQVDPEFEPKAVLDASEGSAPADPKQDGTGADFGNGIGPGDGVNPGSAESGGFWGWLADHGLGLVKGIGAGLLGAAVVGVGALILGASTPVLVAAAGAAVLGGAIHGLIVGSQDFNWTDAIVGSIIGGASAGVGGWMMSAGRTLATKIAVAATDVVAGGLTNLASYLIQTPNPTGEGAMGAFAMGSVLSGAFMGVGAVASKAWNWAPAVLRKAFGGSRDEAQSLVAAAREVEAPAPPPAPKPAGEAPAPPPAPKPASEAPAPPVSNVAAQLDIPLATEPLPVKSPIKHAKKHGPEFEIVRLPGETDQELAARYVEAANEALRVAREEGADYVIKFTHYQSEQVAYARDGSLVIAEIQNGQITQIMTYYRPTQSLYEIFNAPNKSNVQVFVDGVECGIDQLPTTQTWTARTR